MRYMRLALCALVVGLGAVQASAQSYPTRSIRLVVPFGAGGGTDNLARIIEPLVSKALGQPMVIDNKSGAGGTVGTAVAARAPADGSTLLLGDTGLTYAPLIYPSAGFDFLRDFAPISAVARARQLVMMPISVPPPSDL